MDAITNQNETLEALMNKNKEIFHKMVKEKFVEMREVTAEMN